MNQVEFLGLVHIFATVSPSNIQLHQTHSKRYGYSSRDKKIYCCKGSNNYRSHNLIGPYHFLGISPRNLTSFTRLFLAGRRTRIGHKTTREEGDKSHTEHAGKVIKCPRSL